MKECKDFGTFITFGMEETPAKKEPDPNNFGFWFPKIKDCGMLVPKSAYIDIDAEKDKEYFARMCLDNPDEDLMFYVKWAKENVLPLMKKEGIYLPFIKNGTFSNKFEARIGCLPYPDALSVGYAIASINYNALMFGAGGCEQLVVRERVRADLSEVPTIYGGLPLRSEFRVFYDFDKREPLYIVNYWDYNYCYSKIDDITDKIVFKSQRERMEEEYSKRKGKVLDLVAAHMKDVQLSGQWSVDVMLDENGQYWLIDMATAQTSAYWRGAK